MITDVMLNLFGAQVSDIVELAQAADSAEIGAVWVTDHFSGHVVGAPWSRDPFVCMGSIAASTTTVDIGLLVANSTNRHPVQLAAAINSVQSLAPGRVRLGIGSGAAPGTRFASEHEMIGKRLENLETRRAHLVDAIGALRALWAGASTYSSASVDFTDVSGVLDGAPRPQLIVGASAWPTIEVATEHADGVNIRRTTQLADHLERLAQLRLPAGFEVSVLDVRTPGSPLDVVPVDLVDAGVDRYIVSVSAGSDLDAIRALPSRR